MSNSGISRIVMSRPGANASSQKGDYNKRAAAVVSKAVHNQPGTKSRGKK